MVDKKTKYWYELASTFAFLSVWPENTNLILTLLTFFSSYYPLKKNKKKPKYLRHIENKDIKGYLSKETEQ